jgi:hypothetical protein
MCLLFCEHYYTKLFVWGTLTHIIALKDEMTGTFKCKVVKHFLMQCTRNAVITNCVEWKFGIQGEEDENIGGAGETG